MKQQPERLPRLRYIDTMGLAVLIEHLNESCCCETGNLVDAYKILEKGRREGWRAPKECVLATKRDNEKRAYHECRHYPLDRWWLMPQPDRRADSLVS